MNHLAFYGGGVEDIDRMRFLLKKKGVTILYPDRYPHAGGKSSFTLFFEDPDRIKVELTASNYLSSMDTLNGPNPT